MRPVTLLPLLFLIACGGDEAPADSSDSEVAVAAPADRDAWWQGATQRARLSARDELYVPVG